MLPRARASGRARRAHMHAVPHACCHMLADTFVPAVTCARCRICKLTASRDKRISPSRHARARRERASARAPKSRFALERALASELTIERANAPSQNACRAPERICIATPIACSSPFESDDKQQTTGRVSGVNFCVCRGAAARAHHCLLPESSDSPG